MVKHQIIPWAGLPFVICERCGGPVVMNTNYDLERHGPHPPKNFHIMRCTKTKCIEGEKHWSASVFQNTIFSGARLPKNELLHFVYLWVSEATNKWIQKTLGWSHNTVADWKNYFREMCAAYVKHDTEIYEIGGPGTIVQIDESKFGKHKYSRGSRREGVWVFGMIEAIEQPDGT